MCSTSGCVAEKPHCSLKLQHVNSLVFLNRNWHLLETTTASVVNSKTDAGEESDDDIMEVGLESSDESETLPQL